MSSQPRSVHPVRAPLYTLINVTGERGGGM